jgi:predicted RNA-binding Zn ribbon-like protein
MLSREGRGTGAAVAVDLVNTWDEFERDPDRLRSIADVRGWLEWHGFDRAARRTRAQDFERARELRSRFAEIFDAADEDDAVALANALVRELGSPPQLERDAQGWRLRFWPEEAADLEAVGAYAAAGLLEALRELGWSRFGRCGGAPCRCAFVDRSRSGTRIYCCTLCADRVAQAEYRRRQKLRYAS